MANGHPQYTAKQHSGYVFRLRLPRQTGPGELRFSLRTHDRLLAARRAADVALRIKEDLARVPELTRDQIKNLVAEYVRESLASIRDYIVHRRPLDPEIYDDRLEALSLYLSELREGLALNQLDEVKGQVNTILGKHGLSASDELRREFSHALLSASVRLTTTYLEAMRTGHVPGGVGPFVTQETSGPTFGEVLEDWWKKQSKSWARRTLVDYQHIREVVEPVFGGCQVKEIKAAHVEAFGRKLISKGLTPKTANKYIVLVSSVLKYAAKLDLVPKNVAEGMSLPEPKASAQEQREAFSHEDLRMIFGSEWRSYKPNDTSKYWVPFLALYTGCRLEELCQLYTDDIQQLDDVPCIIVQAMKLDQAVKTGEKRVVPMHPVIIRGGFLEFVKSKGSGRIFPDLKRVNNRYGHGLGQWFGRFKKRVGIESPKKVFHSFRHTVATKLKEAGVEDSLVAELLGHKMAGQTFGRYAKASSPRVLLERVVSKLDFGIE